MHNNIYAKYSLMIQVNLLLLLLTAMFVAWLECDEYFFFFFYACNIIRHLALHKPHIFVL